MDFLQDKIKKKQFLCNYSVFFAEWNAGTFDWIPASFYQGCKRTRLCILRIDRKSAFCGKSVF